MAQVAFLRGLHLNGNVAMDGHSLVTEGRTIQVVDLEDWPLYFAGPFEEQTANLVALAREVRAALNRIAELTYAAPEPTDTPLALEDDKGEA